MSLVCGQLAEVVRAIVHYAAIVVLHSQQVNLATGVFLELVRHSWGGKPFLETVSLLLLEIGQYQWISTLDPFDFCLHLREKCGAGNLVARTLKPLLRQCASCRELTDTISSRSLVVPGRMFCHRISTYSSLSGRDWVCHKPIAWPHSWMTLPLGQRSPNLIGW